MRRLTSSSREFLALVAKEWRDVRALTWASMALVVAGCFGLRWVIGQINDHMSSLGQATVAPTAAAAGFVPVCALFYAAMVAADTVGGERVSRRIDGLALLPAGPFRVWSAKAALVLGAPALFLGWCALVQVVALWSLDGMDAAWLYIGATYEEPWPLGIVGLFATATLLMSTVGLRGLGAVLGGGLAAGGLAWAARWYGDFVQDWTSYGRGHAETSDVVIALVLPLVLLGVSAIAFAWGRVHLGKVLRPLAISAASLTALLVAPGAVWASHALELAPGRVGVSLGWDVDPSPDGRFVATTFYRHRNRSADRRPFILDTETGAAIPCGDTGSFLVPKAKGGVWNADGTANVWECEGSTAIRRRIDPRTGEERGRDEIPVGKVREEWDQDYRGAEARRPWTYAGRPAQPDGSPPVVRYRNTVTGAELDVVSWIAPQATTGSRMAQIFTCPEPNVLAVRVTPDAPERRLLTADVPWQSGWVQGASEDGRFVIVRYRDVWQALDLESLALTPLTKGRRPPWWYPVRAAPRRHLVCMRKDDRDDQQEIVDADTGARTTFDPYGSPSGPHAIADGRIVAVAQGAVVLYAADFTPIETRWPFRCAAGAAR